MAIQFRFREVMDLLNLDMEQKGKLYSCPVCHVKSLEVFPDEKGHCHNKECNWSGNSVTLYMKCENVSKDESYRRLMIAFDKGFLQYKEQTYEEAKIDLAKDLEFLAWVRMYEGFYDRPDKIERSMMEYKTGLSKSELNKIINGRVGNAQAWRETLATLRSFTPISKFKRDLELKEEYFKQRLDDEEKGYVIKKYQIKRSRKPEAKTNTELMKDLLRVDK